MFKQNSHKYLTLLSNHKSRFKLPQHCRQYQTGRWVGRLDDDIDQHKIKEPRQINRNLFSDNLFNEQDNCISIKFFLCHTKYT